MTVLCTPDGLRELHRYRLILSAYDKSRIILLDLLQFNVIRCSET